MATRKDSRIQGEEPPGRNWNGREPAVPKRGRSKRSRTRKHANERSVQPFRFVLRLSLQMSLHSKSHSQKITGWAMQRKASHSRKTIESMCFRMGMQYSCSMLFLATSCFVIGYVHELSGTVSRTIAKDMSSTETFTLLFWRLWYWQMVVRVLFRDDELGLSTYRLIQ